jgi:hypothetical protein
LYPVVLANNLPSLRHPKVKAHRARKKSKMDHFYIEFRGHEKPRALIEEGLKSQALARSGALKPWRLGGRLRFSLGLLVALGIIVALLAR